MLLSLWPIDNIFYDFIYFEGFGPCHMCRPPFSTLCCTLFLWNKMLRLWYLSYCFSKGTLGNIIHFMGLARLLNYVPFPQDSGRDRWNIRNCLNREPLHGTFQLIVNLLGNVLTLIVALGEFLPYPLVAFPYSTSTIMWMLFSTSWSLQRRKSTCINMWKRWAYWKMILYYSYYWYLFSPMYNGTNKEED